MGVEISVIITTYNQPFEVIMHSIQSVLMQENVKFELIIADDHSTCDYSNRYREVFAAKGFSSYRLIRNETNLKTVLNIANALDYASGEYVKTIDAGDLLYSPHTLREILNYCKDNDVSVGFGNIVRFYSDGEDGYVRSDYRAPRQLNHFFEIGDYDSSSVLKKQMESADWIPAASQFYRTDVYRGLLRALGDHYGVRYCQDFASVLALGHYQIHHFDYPIYWYEWGTGISTKGDLSSRMRLYADHEKFYSMLGSERFLGVDLRKACMGFKLRKLIATSPFYNAAVGILNRYDAEKHPLDDEFFYNCIHAGVMEK